MKTAFGPFFVACFFEIDFRWANAPAGPPHQSLCLINRLIGLLTLTTLRRETQGDSVEASSGEALAMDPYGAGKFMGFGPKKTNTPKKSQAHTKIIHYYFYVFLILNSTLKPYSVAKNKLRTPIGDVHTQADLQN